RHNAMTYIPSRYLVTFRSCHTSNGNPVSPAFFNHPLQTQIMTLLQHAHPFERSPPRLQRFGNGIDSVDIIHRAVSLPQDPGVGHWTSDSDFGLRGPGFRI